MHWSSLQRFVTFLLLLFLCPCVSLAGLAPKEDAALDKLEELTGAVNTLACTFTQTTDIPLFTEPLISEGLLRFQKPDTLVWEYTSPMKEGFVLKRDKGFRWEDDRSRRVAFTTASDPLAGLIARQMLAWISFDRDWIQSEYAVRVENPSPLSLRLEPKRRDVRNVLSSLTITFAADGVARTILLKEAQGGATTILLHDVVLNHPLDERELR